MVFEVVLEHFGYTRISNLPYTQVLSLLDHRKNIMAADSRVEDIWGRGLLHHAAISGNLDLINIILVQRKHS